MVEYKLFYTKQAQKDAKKLLRCNLKKKAEELLKILTLPDKTANKYLNLFTLSYLKVAFGS